MSTAAAPQLRDDPGVRFGIAHAVLIGVLLLAGALQIGDLATEVLVIAWAFVTGFVVAIVAVSGGRAR